MLALSAVCKIYDTTADMASIRGLANVFVIAGNVWYVYIWAVKKIFRETQTVQPNCGQY